MFCPCQMFTLVYIGWNVGSQSNERQVENAMENLLLNPSPLQQFAVHRHENT